MTGVLEMLGKSSDRVPRSLQAYSYRDKVEMFSDAWHSCLVFLFSSSS